MKFTWDFQKNISCEKEVRSLFFVMSLYFWEWIGIGGKPPVDLYLISEKSIWKSQVWWTGFLVYFKLDFYCLCSLQKSISKLDFAVCRTWFLQLEFSKFKYRPTGGKRDKGKGVTVQYTTKCSVVRNKNIICIS